ncbi:hypothetical protein PFFVO_01742 [Plasmodium falciparum Vietnam Oak-Knoll (FVO)]|uniref:Uncharacterized protein n=1 Tax=Plasmodium falciparum Vietnam Oak-Knoll (FVO) TaxID=1036723 RepID=A0A024V8M9_PLAFA|nr:hypothetical protein PFFVO_01742 [Plasmodium falciparum Vietnam Oak-Knoll (FVO)]
MIKNVKSISVIGNNLDSLSLSYFLQCKKLNVNLLLTNKSTNSINTYHHKKNVIEKGHYTFALNDESYLSLSLLKSLHLKQKGREVIKCNEIILCLNPSELKYFLKKSKLEKKKKNILLQYLSKYDTSKIRITNVCFKKNVLPLSHSLESLLLIKKNEKHKIISLLYDSNIFPNCIPIEEEDDKDIFQTRLRFLSRECDHTLSNIEINYFLENVLKIKEKPDLVVGNTHHVFAFNKNVDVIFKKLIHKYLKRIKIFWSFCFFKNLEYCLRQAKEFSKL